MVKLPAYPAILGYVSIIVPDSSSKIQKYQNKPTKTNTIFLRWIRNANILPRNAKGTYCLRSLSIQHF